MPSSDTEFGHRIQRLVHKTDSSTIAAMSAAHLQLKRFHQTARQQQHAARLRQQFSPLSPPCREAAKKQQTDHIFV